MEIAQLEGDILSRLENGILYVTLNRPAVRNALTPAQRDQLVETFEWANMSLHVRVVVLGSAGDSFCSGADMTLSALPVEVPPEAAPERPVMAVANTMTTGSQRLMHAMLNCHKPILAVVRGVAAGMGAHLALAADLVIASESAQFIEVFVRRGIAIDGAGAYLLTRLVGLHRAKELVFFGDRLSASDAERLGIVNRVVADDELDTAAHRWAERLATGPTKAIGLSKWLLNRAADSDLTTCLGQEGIVQDLIMHTEDANEGVASFRERRTPVFRGW